MNPFSKKIRAFIAQSPPNLGDEDIHSLLEMLYLAYTELNPIDSQAIRNHFRQLEAFFAILSPEGSDQAFAVICRLCSEHERTAFLEGIQIGARLMTELDF